MSVINTNITALISQQNLNRSQSALQTAMERLSSGLRINSAADDAAGQAIANRMTAQITGLAQAQRNANDGISVAQTAEGALNQVNDNLQRIRQLTVQALNDTNSQSDLESIQAEIDQRLAEINRVSQQTSFNGVNVLAQDQQLSIQVGAFDGQQITINLDKINASTLGLNGFSVYADEAATASDVLGKVQNGGEITTDVDGAGAGAAVTWVSNGDGTFTDQAGTLSDISLSELKGKVNATVTNSTAVAVDIDGTAATTYNIAADTGAVTDGAAAAVYVDNDGSLITTGMDTATANPLAALDNAIQQVDSLRSDLGAIQNRFDSAIQNLATTTTNLTAARSRIQDADYAVEVSNMTRAQILQQAGTSVLAQANQLPQTVLSLLR